MSTDYWRYFEGIIVVILKKIIYLIRFCQIHKFMEHQGMILMTMFAKLGDLNADTNGTSDLSGHFFINVLKVSLNLTVCIR